MTAPAGTSAGSYPVSGGATSSGSRAGATASGSFWIDDTAPSAPTNLQASLRGTKVVLSWTAASDAGGSGIARYDVRRGTTPAGSTASTTYSDAPGNGKWTYTVVAVDGAGNTSGPSTPVSIKVGRK